MPFTANLQAQLAEVEGENERKKVVLKQKDKEVFELKKVGIADSHVVAFRSRMLHQVSLCAVHHNTL